MGWRVVVPSGWQVVANGSLVAVDTLPASGSTVWTWDEPRPIPAHTMVVGAAPFAVRVLADGDRAPRHEVWVFADDPSAVAYGAFDRAHRILETLEEFIGPFPYAALAHVQSTTRFGAMENSSAVFYNQRGIANRTLGEATVVHEIAHQWFGDAVTQADWNHLWLSEGFAAFAEILFYDLVGERETFTAQLAATREAAMAAGHATSLLDPTVTDPSALLGALHYDKGALILHMLRREIGDAAFQETLRSYYRTYRDSSVVSSTLAEEAARASGRDLTAFFTQWLTQPGFPMLDVTWGLTADADTLVMRVTQRQPEPWGLYALSLPVAIGGDDQRAIVRVPAARTSELRIPVSIPPTSIAADPDGDLLAEIRTRRAR